MIICPNFNIPEVAREFEELKQATSEQAAYHIWSLNNGNAIDRAPNGAPSKLFLTFLEYYAGDRTKAIQAKAKTYGKSFLNWFGDWVNDPTNASKVVDENGEPLVVYHGSPNQFTEFDISNFGRTDKGSIGKGFYFTTSKERATRYGDLIMPVFISAKKPINSNENEALAFAFGSDSVEEAKERVLDPNDDAMTQEEKLQASSQMTEDLIEESKKYDGTYASTKSSPFFEVVVGNPNQIKSATDNEGSTQYEGTFSRENDDIYYQRSSNVNAEQVQEELDTQINLAVQEQLKKDPNSTTDQIIDIKHSVTKSWAEQRQSEIIGLTLLRLAQAFGLTRNEDGSWSTDKNDEISKLRLEFVNSLGDHAGHITIDRHSTKAHYAIAIGLLEGDASTFNHELAHYYIHTFWNSKLVQTALKIVYDKNKYGDINTVEGRRAVEEALIDAITERSVDDMFDVKLSNKSFFLSFWETLNQLLYKIFNIKTKAALNAILDQITASFLINEQLEQSNREVEIKEILGTFNQSLLQRIRGKKTPTYRQRLVKEMEILYDTRSNQRVDERIVRDITSTTLRKERLYSTRSTGTGDSSIYGIADLIALNQDAVRKVKLQVSTILEAILASDAQTELHEKAQMFMDFMLRSLEEVTRLNRILDNAEANDYRLTAYLLDLNGEKQYSDASGQVLASNPLATIQDFNYDELEYIRDNVLGFIEPVTTAIEGMLGEAKLLGYSDEDINRLEEFLYNTQLIALIKHVLSKYNSATKRKINKWIDYTVDSREDLNDDFKRRLKVNMKNWVSDQMIFGDVNASEIYLGMGSHSKSPIIRAMQDMINDMTDERDELVYQKSLELMDLARKARKAVGIKYKLWGMNFQKLLMQLDKRGLPTGNLLSEYNQGQYYQDLDEFRNKLAFGKNGLESKLKRILGDDFVLQFDRQNLPIIPDNPEAEKLAKDYMVKLDDWKCDHADRLFTKKYYRERNEFLSFKAIRAINSVNAKIEELTKSLMVNGKLRLDLLTESQQDELQQYQLERQFLGNIYTPDGVLKEDGTEERQIADEISEFRARTRNKISYKVDWSSYDESLANAKNKDSFKSRFVHYQINPRVFDLIGHTEYTDKYLQEKADYISTLRSYRNNLINAYKGPSFGQIYWGKLIQDGKLANVDFWKAIKALDNEIIEQVADIKFYIESLGEEDEDITKDDVSTHVGGNLLYKELFESVFIPADRTAPDAWTNPRVLTVFAKMKLLIRDRINNDDSIPAEDKANKIKEQFDLLEYYNPISDKTVPLSIFFIDKPLREYVHDEETGQNIPVFIQMPSGVFTKLDKNESSSEYVNQDFDDSDGVFEKPNKKYKDKRWDRMLKMPKEVYQLYEALRNTMLESWEMVPFLGNYDGRMALITARSGLLIGRQWYRRFGLQGVKNIWNWLKYEFSPMLDDLYYDEHEARERRHDGAINKSIPLRFIHKLERPEMITSDVVGSTIAFYNMALNWRIKSKNLSFFTQLLQRIGIMNASNPNSYRESNLSKVVSGIMDRQLYERRTVAGQTIDNITGTFTPKKFVTAVKSIGKVRAAAHLGLLALNLSSAVISFLDPLMSLVIDSITGRYINALDDLYAIAVLFGNSPKLLVTGGSIYANNKVKAAMQKLHLAGNMAMDFSDTDMSQLTRFISDGITMKLFSFGDYTINAISLVGTMHNYKLYEYSDGHKLFLPKRMFIQTAMQDRGLSVKQAKKLYRNRNTKNMWECCEVDKRTGEFKARDDKFGKYITEENWKLIRKLTQSRSSIYTGVVGDTERTLLQTDAIMAFFTMMRNFLITGVWDRFKSQRDFLVTTFDEDGQATFGDEFAEDKDIKTRITAEEARQHQRYYRGGFSFSTRRIENGIYHAGLLFLSQMGPYLSLLIKSSIFRGNKAMNKYTREKYMKEKDLNENVIYATERIFLELGGWFILTMLIPLTKKAADDNKDDYKWQMLYLLNIRLWVERITYYNPSTLLETITTPATAYSDFKRKLKGLDLLLDFTPLGEHDLDDDVKQGNFKGEKRWKYDLFSMLSSFGLYNWYTNMPEIKIGEYNVGGGDAKTIRNKANFYKKFASWVIKLSPYGKIEELPKKQKAAKTLYEKRQERLKQREKRLENRMKMREKRRNR